MSKKSSLGRRGFLKGAAAGAALIAAESELKALPDAPKAADIKALQDLKAEMK